MAESVADIRIEALEQYVEQLRAERDSLRNQRDRAVSMAASNESMMEAYRTEARWAVARVEAAEQALRGIISLPGGSYSVAVARIASAALDESAGMGDASQ